MAASFKQITTHGSDACLLRLLCVDFWLVLYVLFMHVQMTALVHRLILQIFLLYMTYGWTNLQAGVFGFFPTPWQRIVLRLIGRIDPQNYLCFDVL